MLENMRQFFENRLDGYDAHMKSNIQGAEEFYPFTAQQLPVAENCRILDLGCGTGLELESYFPRNPSAHVTGIDLSPKMLSALEAKFPGRDLKLLAGSYFQLPLGEGVYDAAVSVESLHHFTKEEKIPLYKKLRKALKPEGYFILTDYFSLSDGEELAHREDFLARKAAEGISDGELYHYDTPLTAAHETEALLEAGFSKVEVLARWGATFTLRATK